MAGYISDFWREWQDWFYARMKQELDENGRVLPGGMRRVLDEFKAKSGNAKLTIRALDAKWKVMKLGHHSRTSLLAQHPPTVEPVTAEDVIRLQQEKRERARQIAQERDALQAVAGEKSFRAFIERLVVATAQEFPPPPKYTAPKAAPGVSTETMMQLLSDVHAYELVSAARTRGFNEYTAEVMAARLRRLVDTHVSIKQRLERGGWRYERLVIALNGDIVSGTIHELERHSDAPNIVRAVYGAGLLLAYVIRDLAAHYPGVDVFCISGNHGRLPDAKRMQQKDPTRNWDTMCYLFAREHLRSHEHIQWFIPDSYAVGYSVYDWRFLQFHGQDIKSWNSIPFYGINRYLGNINALEASRGESFHYAIVSHFHNTGTLSNNRTETFINGSVIGGNEFTVNALGKADRPAQWMISVHPEHGVTSRWPVLLDVPPDHPPYPSLPWIDTDA